MVDHSADDEEHAFWDELILNDDGTVDMDAVYAELHDYRVVAQNASRVYYDITCGLISKPNTLATAVISQANECAENITREEVFRVILAIDAGDMTMEDALAEYSDIMDEYENDSS